MAGRTEEGEQAGAAGVGLDALFKARFHGADNVRGIRYQILYSFLRAFDLCEPDAEADALTLEGIEDVELRGLHLGTEYVQVKSSKKPWSWSKLKDPVEKFLQVYRAAPGSRFTLAVDFRLRKDIATLAQAGSLPPDARGSITNKFRGLCAGIGASAEEADALAGRLTIVSIPEKQIEKRLRRSLAEAFELGSEAVDTYILALVAKFLDWATERKTISRCDLDAMRVQIGEGLAREKEFQAYGRGLVDRISWEADARVDDFFDGKGTRPGHIAANADVGSINSCHLLSRNYCHLRV